VNAPKPEDFLHGCISAAIVIEFTQITHDGRSRVQHLALIEQKPGALDQAQTRDACHTTILSAG
jgi:hypothetical protein